MKIRYYYNETLLHRMAVGFKFLMILILIILTIFADQIELILLFLTSNILLKISGYSLSTYYFTRYNFYIVVIIYIIVSVALRIDIIFSIMLIFKAFTIILLFNLYTLTTNVLQTLYLIQTVFSSLPLIGDSKSFNFVILALVTRNSYRNYYNVQKEKMMNNGYDFKFYNFKSKKLLINNIFERSEDILIEIENNLAIRDFDVSREELFTQYHLLDWSSFIHAIIIICPVLIYKLGVVGYELLATNFL